MGTSAYLISAAALQPSIAELQLAIVGVRFFGVSRGVFRYLERLVSHQTTFRLLNRFRGWFFERLEPLAPAILAQVRAANLLSRIVADVHSLENFYIRVGRTSHYRHPGSLVFRYFVVPLSPPLAFTLWLALGLAGMVLPYFAFQISRGSGERMVVARVAIHNALIDGINGLPDLLAFGRSHAHLKWIGSLGEDLAAHQYRTAHLSGLVAAAM